jgi:hypothetical protein
MDMLGFLQRVLPTEGTYCSLALTGNSRFQRFHATVEDMVRAVELADRRGQNTFFAISSFKDGSSRRKVNVHNTRVIPIDVDCGEGKPYQTWKDGLRALSTFVSDMKLPKPLIVRSGNGLHVYWVLDEDLTPDDWVPLASAMKAAAQARKFDVDPGKTADESLVLRPVDTHNFKDPTNPKAVTLLLDSPPVSIERMRKALAYYYNPTVAPKPRNNGLLDSLAVRSDMPPAIGSLVAAKCPQIKWAVENQDKVTEPLWYAVIGVAAFCEEPEETAIQWSQEHPSYSETDTLKKLHHWQAEATGPATCAKFEAERPVGCKGCPFAGRIGSPARLGVRQKEVDTSAAAPKEVITDVPVPKPFKRVATGIVAKIDDVEVPISPFDIYPLSYGYDEHLGYEVAQFMWQRQHVGWKVLTLRQAYLADGTYREFVGSIADQGIVLDTKKQTEYFQVMLRSYMNELRKVRTVTNLYSTMGWKEDNKVFVLGDDLFQRRDDGTVAKDTIRLATHVNRAGSELYTTKGNYATWKAATALLHKARLYPHQFSIGVGLASILMQFTGLKGATVSFYGPSGSGKSLAQLMQQSLWGDPEKLHFQSKFTANSLFNRFGLYGSLPMTVDEATQMTDKDVGDYLYWVSQGRDKARLTRSAEEKAPREWALISTLSTNKPISSKLISAGDETDAQLARLLELRVDPSPVFAEGTDVGRKMHRIFTNNYGWAGRDFLERVMEIGEDGIRAMLAHAFDTFPQRYGKTFSGVERYWEAILVMVELSLRLAHEWDITGFKQTDSINWALSQLDNMRETVSDNRHDMFDLLAQYVNEHMADTLLVYHEANKEPYASPTHVPKGTIRIRIDGRRNAGSSKLVGGTMFLERTHFRQWFAKHGGNPRDFAAQIAMDGADATPGSKKASLGKNTPLSPPQCYVIGVNLRHPRLQSLLEGVDQGHDSLGLGELKVVRPMR